MNWLWNTNFWLPQYPDITSVDFFLWWYVKNYIYGTSADDTSILHARIIKEIQSVAECWPIHRKNWTITLMWMGSLGAPMLRWTKARKTIWVKEQLQISASICLYWLPGNKFLKHAQDLWGSHTCRTENNDKVFLRYIQWSDFQMEELRKQLSKTYLQNMPDKI